jgi:hypothetical protein
MSPSRPRLLTWIAAMLGFEALGFGLAFGLGFSIHSLALRGAPAGSELSPTATIALATLVGALEGTVLGTGQWLVLRRMLPNLRWRAWAASTAIGGALAWALGMGLGSSMTSVPPAWLMAVAFVISGLLFGGLLGGCQAVVLRRHLDVAGHWVVANAVGWMLGLSATYVVSAILDESSPFVLALLLGLAAGATMAIAPAFATGLVLRRASA